MKQSEHRATYFLVGGFSISILNFRGRRKNLLTKFVATKKGAKVLAAMKKGTKLTDNPKDYMLRVRMDNDTLNRLDDLCEKYNTNRSVIVRMGIDKLYQDK